MAQPKRSCDHSRLVFQTSTYATTAGYEQPSLASRIAATLAQAAGRGPKDNDDPSSTYPAPLVLPGDDLAWDPKCPPQSLRSWIRLKERNKVTPERRTVYFAAPPEIEPGLEYLKDWTRPQVKNASKEKPIAFPSTDEILAYLKVFYHGLPVKLLPVPNLIFTKNVEGDAPKAKGGKRGKKVPKSPTLWLNTQKPSGAVGIKTRETPGGAFTHQLNLNDLLDAAIDILPADAYALLMLVEHDIYEDEEDDFACGRAYGGSRIAVVSGARYNPILDIDQDIDREHAWPASHCQQYMHSCCEDVEDEGNAGRKQKKTKLSKSKAMKPISAKELGSSPMYAALAAHASLPPLDHNPSVKALSGLWLGRVARTAGHELGHCFGIGHCSYFSCSMQGTASIIEDARQPPYLCPVDLAKVLRATEVDETERDHAILGFCDRYKEVHLFAAYAAWIRKKLEFAEST